MQADPARHLHLIREGAETARNAPQDGICWAAVAVWISIPAFWAVVAALILL